MCDTKLEQVYQSNCQIIKCPESLNIIFGYSQLISNLLYLAQHDADVIQIINRDLSHFSFPCLGHAKTQKTLFESRRGNPQVY